MTSPDMATPPNSLPVQLINTLQDVQACGVGKEGKLLIQALAAFGDGITKEFYHGFTSVVDAVQAGFDALGEALSGQPGMAGVLGFASDIEGTLMGAIELSEMLLGEVTSILSNLAVGLSCNEAAGNVAENIGGALRDALGKLAAVMKMLFTLIEVIVGVPGATMEDLAAFLSGKWDAIGAVNALAQRIRDAIFGVFNFTPSGDDSADLVAALGGGIAALLPKTDFGGFLNLVKDKASGTTGSVGTTPVQAADALELLRSTAEGAAHDAQNAIELAVDTITDGMKNLGSAAVPVQSALKTFIDLIFGSGTSSGSTPVVRWSQEVLLAAGPVITGQNDLPLGFGSPFPATITSISMVTSEHLVPSPGARVVVQTLRNGVVIHTATIGSGATSYSSGALNLAGIQNGDRITFNVSEASSQMANLSITIAGRYS